MKFRFVAIICFIIISLTCFAQNNKPKIQFMPFDDCIQKGTTFSISFKVMDLDLCNNDYNELLSFEVLEPNSVGITPYTIQGPILDSNGNCNGGIVEAYLQTCGFVGNADSNSKVLIKFIVRDKAGYIDTCQFYVTQSDPVLWEVSINYLSAKGDFSNLIFGQAEKFATATTGDGTDGAPIGTLDKNLCEVELPKVDELTTLDVRWLIPLTLGTQINIYPYDVSKLEYPHTNFSLFPFSKEFRPIEIYWVKTQIPALDDVVKNPYKFNWYIRDVIANGNYIMLNMRTGEGNYVSGMFQIENRGDSCFLTVLSDVTASLGIYGVKYTPVDDNHKTETSFYHNIIPNPFSEITSFQFQAENDGIVKISIYDMLGNCVQELLSEFVTQGYHEIAWQPENISPGAYVCLFQFGNRIEKKIVIFDK